MSTLVHRVPVNSSISNPQLLQGRELVAGRFPRGGKVLNARLIDKSGGVRGAGAPHAPPLLAGVAM